jgi:hypothetical protein
MAEDETCSSCSLAHDEDPGGSASRNRHWLLIEQPGAWGRHALLESKLPAPVAEAIEAKRKELGLRVLLVRRGPGADEPEARQWFYVRSTGEDPYLGGGTFREPAELLDLDLAGFVQGDVRPPDAGGPVIGVCTHGRHDRCCADNGRPVARALRRAGVDAWECSHVGGDRFAANVVSFPHGLFHGRVTPASVLPLVHAYQEGRIHPAGFRGRAAWSPAAQQAEVALRHELDDWAVDSLRLGPHDVDGHRHTITFHHADGTDHEVVVDVGAAELPRLLSCGAEVGRPRVITPVAIRTLGR